MILVFSSFSGASEAKHPPSVLFIIQMNNFCKFIYAQFVSEPNSILIQLNLDQIIESTLLDSDVVLLNTQNFI